MVSLRRRVENRGAPRPAFLIVCEGEKTEPNYFDGFHIKSIHMEIQGIPMDPLSLVKKTIEIRERDAIDGYNYEQVWCVFDKDEWKPEDFNNAIYLGAKENIRIAYSNEAFELWYLLHYDYMTAAITRRAYIEKLKRKPGFGGKYKKNDPDVYNKLISRQEHAIRNATKLLGQYSPSNPSNNNPSTTVHKLVQELRKVLQK